MPAIAKLALSVVTAIGEVGGKKKSPRILTEPSRCWIYAPALSKEYAPKSPKLRDAGCINQQLAQNIQQRFAMLDLYTST